MVKVADHVLLLPGAPAAQMLPVLHHFMQNSSKEHLQCRCMAIHSAGIIAEALGATDPVMGPHIGKQLAVCRQ